MIHRQPEADDCPIAWALFCEQYIKSRPKYDAGMADKDIVRHAWVWFLSGWCGRAPLEAVPEQS